MKVVSLTTLFILMFSCESKLAKPAIEKEEIKNEYSFSPHYAIDFNICGSAYSIT